MMPIWFLAWIIPLCVSVAFILFGLMFAADDSDAEAALLYQRQYEELLDWAGPEDTDLFDRHASERRESGL